MSHIDCTDFKLEIDKDVNYDQNTKPIVHFNLALNNNDGLLFLDILEFML